MKNLESRLEDISEIRSIMEQSSRFLSLSGLSGVCVGILGLLGASAAEWFYSDWIVNVREHYADFGYSDMLIFIISDGLTILVLALACAVYFSTRMARKKNLPVWNQTAKLLVTSLFIPLVAGGVFCGILIYHGLIFLVAPTTLVFYGLGLISASRYTLKEIRYLGFTEVFLGLLASVWISYSILLWALGFGVLHIMYGIFVYYRYEK